MFTEQFRLVVLKSLKNVPSLFIQAILFLNFRRSINLISFSTFYTNMYA